MDFLTTLALIIHLVQQHWEAIAIVVGALNGLYMALKGKAYDKFFALAKDMVVEVADKELSGPEKREQVVDAVYVALPLWAKKLVTEDQAEVLAERAYQVLRTQMAKPPVVEVPAMPSVDPTKAEVTVNVDGSMEIKSPFIQLDAKE